MITEASMYNNAKPLKNNVLHGIADALPTEIFETILQTANIRIERILSQGQQSAADFWYDQDQSEWVFVVKGRAQLEFEDMIIDLGPGDYVNIAAHKKHRVAWTDPQEITVWLAVFY